MSSNGRVELMTPGVRHEWAYNEITVYSSVTVSGQRSVSFRIGNVIIINKLQLLVRTTQSLPSGAMTRLAIDREGRRTRTFRVDKQLLYSSRVQ